MKVNFNLYKTNNIYPAFQSEKSRNKNQVQKPIITDKDKIYFHDYMLAKKLDFKISKKELDNLFQYNSDEFIIRANMLFSDKAGVSEKIAPKLSLQPLPDNMMMGYSPTDNTILINQKNMYLFSEPDKSKQRKVKFIFFAALRHEWQHYLQTMDIYRHKTLGDKAVKYYSQQSTFELLDFSNKIFEKVEENKDKLGIKIDYTKIPLLYRFLEFNNTNRLNKLKKNVRKELGIIEPDSELGKKVELSAKTLLKPHTKGYINHTEEYYDDINEKEARIASYTELFKSFDEISGMQCFIFNRKIIDKMAEEGCII